MRFLLSIDDHCEASSTQLVFIHQHVQHVLCFGNPPGTCGCFLLVCTATALCPLLGQELCIFLVDDEEHTVYAKPVVPRPPDRPQGAWHVPQTASSVQHLDFLVVVTRVEAIMLSLSFISFKSCCMFRQWLPNFNLYNSVVFPEFSGPNMRNCWQSRSATCLKTEQNWAQRPDMAKIGRGAACSGNHTP
eukprot:CAMPEP_0115647868 /NCGR_PEP_ID=MMETSP0272-20121206/39675_1 /TAXON_ID=71861 /ORGANISM="Scrippsiella trochoidea, Strain CCMP3099" /LENGTH=188 /DNA_ID=CAMNT_0003085455 /DNA_START=314 /DNA_END=877 /DNA_ORIENTATION=+